MILLTLPDGASQEVDEDGSEMDALVARGVDLPGLVDIYRREEDTLSIAESYATVIASVPMPQNLNLKFYRNRVPFHGGCTIEEFYRVWSGDYARLVSTDAILHLLVMHRSSLTRGGAPSSEQSAAACDF